MGKILDPASKGTVSGFPPGVMPKTFGQQLTAKEYIDLVSFLLTLKGGAAPAPPASGREGQALADASAAREVPPGRPGPDRGRPALPVRHPAAHAVQRVLALHGGHADGRPGLRLVGLRLVARLRGADLGDAHRARPPPAAPVPRGGDPAPGRLLRLFPGGGRAPRRRSSSARSTRRRRTRSASAARRSTSSTPIPRSGRTSSRTPRTARSTSRPGRRSTSGTACTATATSWTARGTSPTASTRSRPTSSARTRSPSSPRASCSGASPRAARACRRNRRPGTRPCRPGKTG